MWDRLLGTDPRTTVAGLAGGLAYFMANAGPLLPPKVLIALHAIMSVAVMYIGKRVITNN